MKQIVTFLSILIHLCSIANASTISGLAYLENQTNHGGIKVLFTAVSLTAHSDSTYTATNGGYSINLSSGIYNVRFTQQGFESYKMDNFFITKDSILSNITLLNGPFKDISGSVSGTFYSGNTYRVVGNATVNSGKTLIIEPGAKIRFSGFYSFTIDGTLIAKGTKNNLIYFTSGFSNPAKGDWNCLKFSSGSNSQSVLSNCVIEYGSNTDMYDNAQYCMLSIDNNMTIDSCTIRESNSHGIGIGGRSIISNCEINNNLRGGINANNGAPVIKKCKIHNNGWQGIRSYKENTVIENNNIYENYSGMMLWLQKSIVSHNLIYNNSKSGICVSNNGSADIYNNTIYNNQEEGIFLDLANNILLNMNSISDNHTVGLNINYPCTTIICKYNLFNNNWINNFKNPPLGISTIIATNINENQCDSYLNIFINPQYLSTNSNDSAFLKLHQNSPCINAGDPTVLKDMDKSIADIGAYSYNSKVTSFNEIKNQELMTIFPNPAIDYIELSGLKEGAQIQIFDICGKLKQTENFLGSKINISSLHSGYHIVRISFNGQIKNTKFFKQ